MKLKQFQIFLFLIVMFMGAVLSYAFSISNPVLAAGVFFAGAAAIYLCKSRVKGVVEDERVHQVGQKASYVTLRIVTLGLAIGGAVLIATRDLYPGYTDLGFVMAYASCGVLVLYSLFYRHYNKEYGG
ncbi:hypothetical protein EO95_07590 [Methanosarcina sp. 1.H.T.1A.1]|uniref:DUF2178 domain-containing protein n=1 Tax=Methanosarcina sp. 1.H.T.1A.1 TaxID=1483602 RepID=UPI000621ABD0|nr:DUF2178 domain-containing protein [Methanosarcina sp. 1.H.T.1A.1]KKH95578.1 hypothetical protein EO95_07590 [Methanosarcina sp. 1.H.T.1A.1]